MELYHQPRPSGEAVIVEPPNDEQGTARSGPGACDTGRQKPGRRGSALLTRVVAKIGLWSAADWGSKFSASVLALMSRMMLNPQLPARQKNSPPGPCSQWRRHARSHMLGSIPFDGIASARSDRAESERLP